MNPTDPRVNAALDAAINQIRTTVAAVAARLCETLGAQAGACLRLSERDALLELQQELRRNLGVFQRVFHDALRQKVQQELSPRAEPSRALGTAQWQTLTLVEDREVEERINFERIGQMISHECEWQLRELAPYMGALTGLGRIDEERNPLRGDVLGAALFRGIEAASGQPEGRKTLVRELGQAMAHAMPVCYADILTNLQQRGIQPVMLTVRTVEGPGHHLAGLNSTYTTLPERPAGRTGAGEFSESSGSGSGADLIQEHRRAFGGPGAGQRSSGPTRGRSGPGEGGGAARYHGHEADSQSRGQGYSPADAQLMDLLRRLSAVASRSGEFNPVPLERGAHREPAEGSAAGMSARGGSHPADASGYGSGSLEAPSGHGQSISGHGLNDFMRSAARSRSHEHPATLREGTVNGDGVTGLMAVNLIRAHRDELMQASNGKLDHMVIDVVGSLFDQILSDSRVPPQMARQIARLQLPVLRVALVDQTFFSTRRHPVRRFINRIASLACAFDTFDEGPGKQFLARVAQLVQEIIEGDFDQIEIYTAKLAELERFIAEQTEGAAAQSGAASTLATKESELHIQQRYMQQLRTALRPLQLPAYLAEFLPQVWSQALVLAVRRDGPDSDRAKRFRRVGCDVVMSVQPKGSPAFRKKFLMQLPPLMKDLNEGMQLIGWPEAAQREFFGKLLPAHAESLKGTPLSELDHNLMVKQLEAIFNLPVPGTDAVSLAEPLTEPAVVPIEGGFTTEEARQVGLVPEAEVNWSEPVAVPASDSAEPAPAAGAAPDGTGATADAADLTDGQTSTQAGDPGEPISGPQLIDHVKVGLAYQMHLKDEWQKVRLTHVSPGRSFFVFTRGEKHQETISMTSRMLARMCETGRLRGLESVALMERATHRARKQLVALKAPSRH